MNLRNARKTFRTPPRNHHPIALWFGERPFDVDRLSLEFDVAIEAGMGGVAMYGLTHIAPQDEKSWMDALSSLVRRAYKKQASIGLHDKPMADPAGTFAAQGVRMEIVNSSIGVGERPLDWLAVYTLANDFSAVDRTPDFAIVDRNSPLPTEGRLAIFRVENLPGAYNFLDARATHSFVARVYEPYRRAFRRYFGYSLLHSFVGEAGLPAATGMLPWDDDLEPLFREARGYSIVDNLPSLFYEIEGFESVRFDYWSLVADMFREGFAAPLDAWCRKNRLLFSGHYPSQSPICDAVPSVGSAMALHEFEGRAALDVPLRDFLRYETTPERYANAVMALKQASSVDHQLGKGGTLTGSYHPPADPLPPAAVRTATHVQMALGAGFIGLHDVDRGGLDIHALGAAGRTSWILTQGQHASDVLFLHPGASVQAVYSASRLARGDADRWIDRHAAGLSLALLDAQIDFDYGDPELMARYGRVDQKLLAIGPQRYSAIVLPPILNIRFTTLELLMDFAVAGGTLIAVGSAPTFVDGRPSPDGVRFVAEYAERIVDGVDRFDYRGAVQALRAKLKSMIVIKGERGEHLPELKIHRRVWDDAEILYIANEAPWYVSARVILGQNLVSAVIDEWDTGSGDSREVSIEIANGRVSFAAMWGAGEARTYVIFPGKSRILESGAE